MLIAVVFAVLALALWFPETRIGGMLRRLLIDLPVRWLNRIRRGHVVLALLVFGGLYLAHAIGRDDGLYVAGQLAGEGLNVALAVDLATWIDITAIALLVAATVRFREVIGLAAIHARQWARRCAGLVMSAVTSLARSRARRARGTPRPRRGEDPDGPAPGLAWALDSWS